MAGFRTTSSLSLGRHAQSLRRAKRLVAVELALGDEVFGELGQILEKYVLSFVSPPDNLLFDLWVHSVLNC